MCWPGGWGGGWCIIIRKSHHFRVHGLFNSSTAGPSASEQPVLGHHCPCSGPLAARWPHRGRLHLPASSRHTQGSQGRDWTATASSLVSVGPGSPQGWRALAVLSGEPSCRASEDKEELGSGKGEAGEVGPSTQPPRLEGPCLSSAGGGLLTLAQLHGQLGPPVSVGWGGRGPGGVWQHLQGDGAVRPCRAGGRSARTPVLRWSLSPLAIFL